jgi:hypothetical protein
VSEVKDVDQRREQVREILEKAKIEVELALENLDDYSEHDFLEVLQATPGLVGFFPTNTRNRTCY